MMPITRLSTAPTSHVVQPRFDPPATTNWLIAIPPPSFDFMNSCVASIALTPDFTMASRTSHSSSFVAKCFTHSLPPTPPCDPGFPLGEPPQPLILLRGEMLHARIGDEVVLLALLVLGIPEHQRLVRNHAEIDHHRLGLLRDPHRAVARLLR